MRTGSSLQKLSNRRRPQHASGLGLQPMNGQAKDAMRDGGAGLAQTMDHGLRPGSPVKASSDCSSLKPQRGLDNCLRIETSTQSPLHARHALE